MNSIISCSCMCMCLYLYLYLYIYILYIYIYIQNDLLDLLFHSSLLYNNLIC